MTDPYGRFFASQDDMGQCALYAIQNLLQTNDVTADELDESAQKVAEITKDDIENHYSDLGFWSSDSIVHYLMKHGYSVSYEYKLNVEDNNIIGYICQVPSDFHYVTVRRSSRKEGYFEVVDSMRGIETVSPTKLEEYIQLQKWNLLCIKSEE